MDPLLAPQSAPSPTPTVASLSFARFARHPLTTLFSLAVMAAAIALPLILLTFSQHAINASRSLEKALDFTIFLEPSLSSSQAQEIAVQIGQRPDVQLATYISKDEGLKDFKAWSNLTTALDNLPENPLPASIVVRPKIQPNAAMATLVQSIKTLKGVQKVSFDARWTERYLALRQAFVALGDWLAGISITTAVVVMLTVLHLDLRGRYYALLTKVPVNNRLTWLKKICIFEGLWMALASVLLGIGLTKAVLIGCQPWVSSLAATYKSQFTLSGPDFSYCLIAVGLSLIIGIFAGSLSARA